MHAADPQRQRHGVSKNPFETIGGLAVGAALILLIRNGLGRRPRPRPHPDTPASGAQGPLPGVEGGAERVARDPHANDHGDQRHPRP